MADYHRVLVYGGYGGTGKLVAEMLATHAGLAITIAGRNGVAATEAAAQLTARLPECSFNAIGFDADDSTAFRVALADIDLLIVSAPLADKMDAIGRIALDTGTDLLDILVRGLAAEKLLPLSDEARRLGRAFVTQAGFHPGVPGPMMRAAAEGFSPLESVHVGMAMQVPFRDASSIVEIVDDLVAPVHVLDGGKWRVAGYKDMHTFTFSPPLGEKTCYPLNMPEIAAVGRQLGVGQAGVYAAGFNWFVDYIVFPMMAGAARLGGSSLARKLSPLFYWGNEWFSPKDQCIEMRAVATGEIDGVPTERSFCLFSTDAYGLTAHCVLAAVRQMIDGPLAEPGVMLMGERIDHSRLFGDLAELGARIWMEPDID